MQPVNYAHSWLRVTGNHKYSDLRQALISQATQWVTYNSLDGKVPGQPWAGMPMSLRTLTEKTETGQKRLTLAGGMSEGGGTSLRAVCIQVPLLTHRHRLQQLQMRYAFKNGHGYLFLDSL